MYCWQKGGIMRYYNERRTKMIMCPRCLTKINKEKHDVEENIFYCPNKWCKQELRKDIMVSCVPFPDCVTKVKYVGLNSWEDANQLLKMMQ